MRVYRTLAQFSGLSSYRHLLELTIYPELGVWFLFDPIKSWGPFFSVRVIYRLDGRFENSYSRLRPGRQPLCRSDEVTSLSKRH